MYISIYDMQFFMDTSLVEGLGEKAVACNLITDEEILIAGCRRGDPEAQRLLYTKYASKMFGVCCRYVDNRDVAQDILQEGFIKIFDKIDTYKGDGAFGGWVRRIFVNTSLEYLRKNRVMRFSVAMDECKNIEDEINESALSRLCTEDLLTCISQLPVGYRTVFNLYAIEGFSHEEISKILNIKESTSQSQLVRAKKLLQKNVKSIIGNEYAKQG